MKLPVVVFRFLPRPPPLPIAARMASAQAYPSRPVRWLVGYAPGGSNDIVARLMGRWFSGGWDSLS
jgi:hypothetical protein